MSSAPRGLAPREGLELEMMKLGCNGPPLEPHRRLQAGKSWDPHSQNANSSPRAQDVLGLSLAEKRRGKCGALRAPSACGLGRRLLGPAVLRACPFASLPDKAQACLRPGGYCRCSGNGGPQTCLPMACGVAQVVAQYGPSSSAQDSRPSRGAKPRGVDDPRLPQERPRQAGSRGGGEIKARVPR